MKKEDTIDVGPSYGDKPEMVQEKKLDENRKDMKKLELRSSADIVKKSVEDSVEKENTHRYRIAGYESRHDYVLGGATRDGGEAASGLARFGEPIIWDGTREETQEEKDGRRWMVTDRSPVQRQEKFKPEREHLKHYIQDLEEQIKNTPMQIKQTIDDNLKSWKEPHERIRKQHDGCFHRHELMRVLSTLQGRQLKVKAGTEIVKDVEEGANDKYQRLKGKVMIRHCSMQNLSPTLFHPYFKEKNEEEKFWELGSQNPDYGLIKRIRHKETGFYLYFRPRREFSERDGAVCPNEQLMAFTFLKEKIRWKICSYL